MGSTVVEKNLDRITVVVALVFVFCTVGLGLAHQIAGEFRYSQRPHVGVAELADALG